MINKQSSFYTTNYIVLFTSDVISIHIFCILNYEEIFIFNPHNLRFKMRRHYDESENQDAA